jgi:hypothetical protein
MLPSDPELGTLWAQARISSPTCRLLLRLLQPVRHAHLAVHRRRNGEVFLGLLALVRTAVELAEAEVAVGDEGAHAARLGEGKRFAVVGLAALGIETPGMGCDVAEKVQRMGREPGVPRRGLDRAVAQAPPLVEPAEQQTGATQRVRGTPPATLSFALPLDEFGIEPGIERMDECSQRRRKLESTVRAHLGTPGARQPAGLP